MATMKEKIGQYVQLRDYKAEAKKQWDESMERVNAAMKKLEAEFLAHLQETEQESVRTKNGTVYKKTQSSCSVQDRDEFFQWANATGNEDAMDIRANKTNVRKLLNNGVVVPGVNYSQIIQVGVRRGDDNE